MKPLLPFAGFFLALTCGCLSSTEAPENRIKSSAERRGTPSQSEDTPWTTIRGHAFTVPAGWSVERRTGATVLTTPEGDSRIALVDVEAADVEAADVEAIDAEAAVAHAWAAYDATANWPLLRASDRPVRDGWQAIRSFRYETSSSGGERDVADRRDVIAQARRRGDSWVVVIYDMTPAVGDKRDAQIDLVFGSLTPKGYVRESLAGRKARVLDAPRLELLRRFVEDARQGFEVPGLALGIVQEGRVVLAEGFGVRELGKPEKVDANTLFMVASNTKSLTSLMLAKLVDGGHFEWTTRATEVLPSFRLGHSRTTRRVRIKHLVCACTGMPRQDMEWIFEGENGTPQSVLQTLADMKPTSPFGELYQYSNSMVAAAGFAGGHSYRPQLELGAAYDEAMQDLVFDPLGMSSTTFDFDRAQSGNAATPHAQDFAGLTVPVSMDFNETAIPSRPDGGAWSDVEDLLRYVQVELSRGLLPDGSRYIDKAPLLARREQQVARGEGLGYGLGLKIDRRSGVRLIHHGGSMLGFVSDVMWLPDHQVGAVILTNEDNGSISLRSLFRRRFLEVLFDGEPRALLNLPIQIKRKKESIADERAGLRYPADPALADRLAPRYRNPALGEIDVSRHERGTLFDFGGWKSEMASRGHDGHAASMVTAAPGLIGLEFLVTQEDGRRALLLKTSQQEYLFVEAE